MFINSGRILSHDSPKPQKIENYTFLNKKIHLIIYYFQKYNNIQINLMHFVFSFSFHSFISPSITKVAMNTLIYKGSRITFVKSVSYGLI